MAFTKMAGIRLCVLVLLCGIFLNGILASFGAELTHFRDPFLASGLPKDGLVSHSRLPNRVHSTSAQASSFVNSLNQHLPEKRHGRQLHVTQGSTPTAGTNPPEASFKSFPNEGRIFSSSRLQSHLASHPIKATALLDLVEEDAGSDIMAAGSSFNNNRNQIFNSVQTPFSRSSLQQRRFFENSDFTPFIPRSSSDFPRSPLFASNRNVNLASGTDIDVTQLRFLPAEETLLRQGVRRSNNNFAQPAEPRFLPAEEVLANKGRLQQLVAQRRSSNTGNPEPRFLPAEEVLINQGRLRVNATPVRFLPPEEVLAVQGIQRRTGIVENLPVEPRFLPNENVQQPRANGGNKEQAQPRFLPPENFIEEGPRRTIRQQPKFSQSLESQGFFFPGTFRRAPSLENEAELLIPRTVTSSRQQQPNQGTPSQATPLPATRPSTPVTSTLPALVASTPAPMVPVTPIQPAYANGVLNSSIFPTPLDDVGVVARRIGSLDDKDVEKNTGQPVGSLEEMAKKIISGTINDMDSSTDQTGSKRQALLEVMRSIPRFLTRADFTTQEREIIYGNSQDLLRSGALVDESSLFRISNAEFFRTNSYGNILALHYYVPTQGDGGRTSSLETIVLDLPDRFRPVVNGGVARVNEASPQVLGFRNSDPSIGLLGQGEEPSYGPRRTNGLAEGNERKLPIDNSKQLVDDLAIRKKTEPFATIQLKRPFKQSIEEHMANQTSIFARRSGDSESIKFTDPQEVQKREDNKEGRLAAARLLARERSLKFNEPEENSQKATRLDAAEPKVSGRTASDRIDDAGVLLGRSGNIELPSAVGNDATNEIEGKTESPFKLLAPERSTELLRGGVF